MCDDCEQFPPRFVAHFNAAGGKFWRPARHVAPAPWAIDIRPAAPVEIREVRFVCDAAPAAATEEQP